jgi:archaellum component FlaC
VEDKVIDLISRMYAEMQDGFKGLGKEIKDIKQDVGILKEDVSGLKQDVSILKEDVSGLKQDVGILKEDVTSLKQDIIRIENKMDDKFGALFDGYTQHGVRLERVENKIDDLVSNYERQDVKIEVIHSRAK